MDGFSLLLLFVILWLGDRALDAAIGRLRAAAQHTAQLVQLARTQLSAPQHHDEPCPIPDQ